MLEKCVGTCRSMVIAVPCAILYTRAQYQALAKNLDNWQNPRLARRKHILIRIRPNSELENKLNIWLQLHMELINGNAWLCTEKLHLTLTAFTDASSRRWGEYSGGQREYSKWEGILQRNKWAFT